jgi:hypothetical protein
MEVETVPDDGKSKKTASSSRLRTLTTSAPKPKGPTEADLRKKDPEHAKKILESRFPDPVVRRATLGLMAETIREAHRLGPRSWELTFNPAFITLAVGPDRVMQMG